MNKLEGETIPLKEYDFRPDIWLEGISAPNPSEARAKSREQRVVDTQSKVLERDQHMKMLKSYDRKTQHNAAGFGSSIKPRNDPVENYKYKPKNSPAMGSSAVSAKTTSARGMRNSQASQKNKLKAPVPTPPGHKGKPMGAVPRGKEDKSMGSYRPDLDDGLRVQRLDPSPCPEGRIENFMDDPYLRLKKMQESQQIPPSGVEDAQAINDKKTAMSMLYTEVVDAQQSVPPARNIKRPATAAAAMAVEKRKVKNEVDSHLTTSFTPTINLQKSILPKMNPEEMEMHVSKQFASNSAFRIQPYDSKYDDEKYIEEIIKRDTGHVISLKTKDKLVKMHKMNEERTEKIRQADLQEMKDSRVEITKYANQISQLVERTVSVSPPPVRADMKRRIGIDPVEASQAVKAERDRKDREEKEEIERVKRDKRARAWEDIDTHTDNDGIYSPDRVDDKVEEPKGEERPVERVIAKDDSIEDIDVGGDDNNMGNEDMDNKIGDDNKKDEDMNDKIDEPEIEKDGEKNCESQFEEEVVEGDQASPVANPDEDKINEENNDPNPEKQPDNPKQEDDENDSLAINSDIDPRFLSSYEFKYSPPVPPIPLPVTPAPEEPIPPVRTREEEMVNEIRDRQVKVDMKYVQGIGDIEIELQRVREKESMIRAEIERREREETEKARREKIRRDMMAKEGNKGTMAGIGDAFNRIESVKNKITHMDMHAAIERQALIDKANAHFTHKQSQHPPAPSIQDAKQRMAEFLKEQESKVNKNNRPAPVQTASTYQAEKDEIMGRLKGAEIPSSGKGEKNKAIGEIEAKIAAYGVDALKLPKEQYRHALKSAMKPSPTTQPVQELDEESRKMIRDRLVKTRADPQPMAHPWIDFD